MESKLRRSACLAALLALGACSVPQPDSLAQAQARCQKGGAYDEVQLDATVVRVLGMRESRSGLHEGFLISSSGVRILVEDNADITGPIPLRSGERIRLQGQFECDDGVIHWTHRDPSGRHIAGYVEANGKYYR